tara:strand:+ start:3136 stop:5814 length:2679 start_codon:yes stop_codon:yes gene_type:complete
MKKNNSEINKKQFKELSIYKNINNMDMCKIEKIKMLNNNIKNKMSIITILKKSKIEWCYIFVKSQWNGKKWLVKQGGTTYLDGRTWKSSHKTYRGRKLSNEILQRQEYFNYLGKKENPDNLKELTNIYITYKTSYDFPVIDIDDLNIYKKVFENNEEMITKFDMCSNYASRGSRLPHLLHFKLTDRENKLVSKKSGKRKTKTKLRDSEGNEYGDLLMGGNDCWVRVGEQFTKLNDNDVIELDFSDLNFADSCKPKKKKKTKKQEVQEEETAPSPQSVNNNNYDNQEFTLEQINDLLNCIDDERLDDHKEWGMILQVLKGIQKEKPNLDCKSLFIQHSNRSPKADFIKNSAEWDNYDIDNYNECSIGTLCYWAQDDKPEKYQEYCTKYHQKIIKKRRVKKYLNKKKLKSYCFRLSKDYSILPEVVEYLNDYFAILKGSRLNYIGLHLNKKQNFVIYDNKMSFIANYEEFGFVKGVEREYTTLIGEWLKHPNRRIYDNQTFRPCIDYEEDYIVDGYNELNFFRGWKHTYDKDFEYDENIIKQLKDHHLNVIFNGDQEFFDHFHKSIKLILLGHKIGVAWVLWGIHGTGKNAFLEFIGKKIFGEEYYCSTKDINHIIGNFNALMANKIWTVIDELSTWDANGKKSIENANAFKSAITNVDLPLERKGKDTINVKDFNNYCVPTNFVNSVRVEHKTDRRFNVKETSTKYANNTQYHAKIRKDYGEGFISGLTVEEKQRADTIAYHYFHYIMSFDVENYKPSSNIPMTDSRRSMIVKSTPSIATFICNYCKKLDVKNGKSKEPKFSDLFDLFKQFCGGYEKPMNCSNSKVFAMKMNNVVFNNSQLKGMKKHTNKGSVVILNEINCNLIRKTMEKRYLIQYFEDFKMTYDGYDFDDDY